MKGVITGDNPFQIPMTSLKEARAIKDFSQGKATEDQQITVYDYILKKLCNIGGLSIMPNREDMTNFNEGKRFCAVVLNHISNEPMNALKKTCLTLTKQEKENE